MEDFIFESLKYNIFALDRNIELQKSLVKYLKKNGFEYAAKKIMKILVLKEPRYLGKVQFMLEDIGFLKKSMVIIKTNLPQDRVISYSKLKGLDENFTIKYNSIGYFEILSVQNEKKKFIKCNISKKNTINISVKIPKRTIEEFTDRIILRTDREIKVLTLNIRCIESNRKYSKEKEFYEDIKELKNKKDKDYFNLYNGLLCEKMLIDYSIITENIASLAKRMYKTGIYTKNTPKALRIINRASNIDSNNQKLIILESYDKEFDLNLVNRIIKFCKEHREERMDEVINRLINSKEFYFKEELIPIIYSFYKRNEDMNSLDILTKLCINNNLDIYEYVKKNDINKLLHYYVKNKKENDRNLIFESLNNSNIKQELKN